VQGNELLKTALNRAFFGKLYVDAGKITGHELNEPFDVLLGAYEQYVIGQAAVVLDELTSETKSVGLLMESDADNLDLAGGPTCPILQVSGWRGNRMVDLAGIEPLVSPQVADATHVGWDRGGRVGDVPADAPRRPDTDRRALAW
jgi:hypothetical protein